MNPINEFEFDTITANLKKEYIKFHNNVIKDLSLLNSKNIDSKWSSYINVFLSRFKKIDDPKSSVLQTIICSSRNELLDILDLADENTLITCQNIKILQDSRYSVVVRNRLKTVDDTAEISLGDLLFKIFNYDGKMKSLLEYYSSNNYVVCSYCLAQSTIIYKSSRTKKYYLTGNLDHVKSKDKNPFLSISINNLIPVCGPCNQRKSTEVFTYNPFNTEHVHSFDFNECIDYDEDKCEVYYKSLLELKISADKDEYMDMSKKLDYIDLYSNFETNAQILVERYKKFNSEGYSEHLNQIIDSSNTRELIEYLISETPLTDDNILKYPLTKFKMDLFNTLKSKCSEI